MPLLDVSLAHAREVPTHPVMEGVLVSSEGERRKTSPARPEGSHASCHTDGRTPPRHACAPVVSNEGTTQAGGGVAGLGGTARADSGGLCLKRPAARAHTEEVDPCPPTCMCPSKTRTKS
jgi:hypothetical protein